MRLLEWNQSCKNFIWLLCAHTSLLKLSNKKYLIMRLSAVCLGR